MAHHGVFEASCPLNSEKVIYISQASKFQYLPCYRRDGMAGSFPAVNRRGGSKGSRHVGTYVHHSVKLAGHSSEIAVLGRYGYAPG